MRTGRTHAAVIAAALSLASCHAKDKATPDHWSDAPAPSPAPTLVPTPGPYPLGEICDASQRKAPADAGYVDHEHCGRDGRVAVITFRSDPLPKTPSAVLRKTTLGTALVSVEGSRLWIDTECLACRAIGHRLWVADLARMTDQQKRDLQDVAGLPGSPILDDAAAWRAALAKG